MTVRIITGDALAVLGTLDSGSVQCCVTSPPYYGLRDYGVDGQIGLEDTPEAFVTRLVDVFREVRRVLRDDGTLWLNIGDSYAGYHGNKGHALPTSSTNGWNNGYNENLRRSPIGQGGIKTKDLLGIPWMLAFALRADGWFLRSDIIWHKPSTMPESVRDRPTRAHEYVFLMTKRASYFYDAEAIKEPTASLDPTHSSYRPNSTRIAADGRKEFAAKNEASMRSYDASGRNARSVWTIATQPFSAKRVQGWEEDHDHYAVMPPDLAERCIKAGTSERGICPHCAAPWRRQVDRQRLRDGQPITGSWKGDDPTKIGASGVGHWRDSTTTTTVGWEATCDCPPHSPARGGVVLDPFGGAGTTGMVADRLGRDAVLIELNPKNAALARARITADAPLFAGAGS